MAKRETKVVPARKSPASEEDSLLIRSAESLGRVVGSLQRQMQGATKRMSNVAEDAMDALPEMPQMGKRAAGGSRKRSGARKAAAPRKGEARKRTGARTKGAEKPAGARKTSRRKTGGRSR